MASISIQQHQAVYIYIYNDSTRPHECRVSCEDYFHHALYTHAMSVASYVKIKRTKQYSVFIPVHRLHGIRVF